MPRGRPPRDPSGRNLEVYHELVCEGRRQADVALRFRVSRPRIAEIRRDVAAWVEFVLPGPESAGLDAGQRLHVAIAVRRKQLDAAYAAYLDHFGGVGGAMGLSHLLAASDAGVLPPAAKAELLPRTLLESAVRMGRELDALARVAQRGPLADRSQLAAR